MKLLSLLVLLLYCLEGQAYDIDPIYDELKGTYISPPNKYTGTKLSLDRHGFRYEFYTDMGTREEILENRKSGTHLIENNKIYIPVAGMYRRDSEPKLLTHSHIASWHITKINNITVLLRDDEYESWTKHHEHPSSYGTLIKVSDQPDKFDLERPSLDVLFPEE